MVSLGTPLENGEGMKPSPLVELNPKMLVRDVERMRNVVAGRKCKQREVGRQFWYVLELAWQPKKATEQKTEEQINIVRIGQLVFFHQTREPSLLQSGCLTARFLKKL